MRRQRGYVIWGWRERVSLLEILRAIDEAWRWKGKLSMSCRNRHPLK